MNSKMAFVNAVLKNANVGRGKSETDAGISHLHRNTNSTTLNCTNASDFRIF